MEEFLRAIGAPLDSDPELIGTPDRVASAFTEELLSGYDASPEEILSETVASRATGLVVVTDIATATVCPHHLLPATGVAHVAYLPGERVVGLGALGKLVDCFSRRLALQEDIAANVADALMQHLGARGAACTLDLAPTCMTVRGERRHSSRASTMALRGLIEADAGYREAFVQAFSRAGLSAKS